MGRIYFRNALDVNFDAWYSLIVMKVSNCVKIFKALSNEQRLKIFMMIYKQCGASAGSVNSSELKLKEERCCPIKDGIQGAFTKMCGCIKLSKSTISHHFKRDRMIFWMGALPGISIAIWFSSLQLMGYAHCPVLFRIPLCFASLATFTILIILNRKG